jgi:hypothetical protein
MVLGLDPGAKPTIVKYIAIAVKSYNSKNSPL